VPTSVNVSAHQEWLLPGQCNREGVHQLAIGYPIDREPLLLCGGSTAHKWCDIDNDVGCRPLVETLTQFRFDALGGDADA
jgi:hypothetical protein